MAGPADRRSFAYLLPDSNDSSSSISTTATAPNLPGSGRVVGLVYDELGDGLVNQINRLAASRRKANGRDGDGRLVIHGEANYNERGTRHSFYLSPDAGVSTSTISTTATTSNIPGPGRVLGLAYEKLGKLLVLRLNRLAVRFGRGPDAAAQRIAERFVRIGIKCHKEKYGKLPSSDMDAQVLLNDGSHWLWQLINEGIESSRDAKKLRRDYRRLLRYVGWARVQYP